jgi:hypothetical protein
LSATDLDQSSRNDLGKRLAELIEATAPTQPESSPASLFKSVARSLLGRAG